MNGKRKYRVARYILLLLLVITAVYGLIVVRIGFADKDTESLNLKLCSSLENPFSNEEHAILDFSDKQVISPWKFGFYHEIVVEEKIVVVQDVDCSPKRGYYFGIYKDKRLSVPVEEVSLQYLYRDGIFEEGGDPLPYDETRDQVVVLEPGSYYIGVYCRNPFSDEKVKIDNWYGCLHEEAEILENQWIEYFVAEENQENYFHFTARKTGRIQIEASYNSGAVQLCDEKRRPVSDAVIFDGASREPIKFTVTRNKKYYLKVFGGQRLRTPDGSFHSMVPQTIKYEF